MSARKNARDILIYYEIAIYPRLSTKEAILYFIKTL